MSISYTHPRRIPRVERKDLDQEGKAIFDQIEQTRGGVWGPYSALLHSPQLADRIQSVGEYLRFQGKLPGAFRELAILTAAVEGNCPFEWIIHEPIAREEGCRDETIDYLRTGKETELEQAEKLTIECIRSLLSEKTVPDLLYKQLAEKFSTEEIIELYSIAGFYQLLAFVINGFDVPAPHSELPAF